MFKKTDVTVKRTAIMIIHLLISIFLTLKNINGDICPHL